MPPREFPVEQDEHGSRLETYLRRRLGLPRLTALKALRKGWVRVDGRRAKGEHRLQAGEVVRITNYALPIPALDEAPRPRPPVPPAEVARARAALRCERPDLLVASKPAGVPVHAGSGHAWGFADALGEALADPTAPVPIGRLDRDTSGLLLLARGRGPSRALFAQLRADEVARDYLALVEGHPEPAQGTIDLPLEKAGAEGQEQMRPDPEGRPAVTHYALVERLRGAALLRVTLETGRTHQIRAHLAARGHPLLGDPRYAGPAGRTQAERLGLERLFLHAGWLRCRDPESGEPLSWEEPLPPELERVLARLR